MATPLNEFGKKIFSQIVQEEKNVVVSPLSIFSALSMVSLGANGVTKEEILKALHFGAAVDVESQIEKLLAGFQTSIKANILSLANNVFVNPSFTLNEGFVSDVKKVFNSEITTKDCFFSKSQESASEINKWVEEQTQNKIKDLVSAQVLDKNTMLVLVSAIYFKANWQQSFNKADTKEADFHVTSKKLKGKKLQYGENEAAKWVKLEYKPKGKEFNAIFVLPQNAHKLSDVISFLFSPDNVLSLPTEENAVETLAIPKFKIEYGTEMKKILQKIGIRAVFNSKDADLKGIAENEDLMVSNVIHKAVVEVDEEGTVAAAATAILTKRKRLPGHKPLTFIADQPFFFLLEHVPSQSIVFTAKVHDPAE